MRRSIVVAAVAAALVISSPGPGPAASAGSAPGAAPDDRVDTSSAERALTTVQGLLERASGTAAEGGRTDVSLAMRDLFVALPRLSAADRRTAEVILARPTDGASDPIGDGYTVQGNLLERDTCWPAMARAYEAGLAEGAPFSERLLRALEAAEIEGGDVRGRQSSAIVIVEGTLQPNAWKGRVLDARVDDHPDPVPELRRIVNLYEAYALFDPDATAELGESLDEAAAYAEARRRAPEATELVFWMWVEHAKRGEVAEARRELAIAFDADTRWRTTLQHLGEASREGMTPELVDELLADPHAE